MAKREAVGVGNFMHVYNRGANRTLTFLDQQDYERLLATLYLANGVGVGRPSRCRTDTVARAVEVPRADTLTDIFAFCLMPNHLHLLCREKTPGGTSRFLQRVGTSYTKYFNLKHGRNGCLLQGPFKSKAVKTDSYLQHLIGYIHANPRDVPGAPNAQRQEELLNFLLAYPYSSGPTFAGFPSAASAILFPDAASVIGDPQSFRTRMEGFVAHFNPMPSEAWQ